MQNYPAVKVTVLGSGTSMGVPVIGCKCKVCTSDDPRNTRLRSSIKLTIGERTILIDCGVDMRHQLLRRPIDHLDAVLITHTHADHLHGLDDLRAFCYFQRQCMPIYTTRPFIDDINVRFAYAFNPPQMGGGVPLLDLIEITPGQTADISGVPVLPLEIMHGKLPILGFRFGPFAYLTDCSLIPDETAELLAGVDTVVVSALREREHPTHFNISQATEAARKLGVKKAYLIHMAHDVEHAETEAELPDWVRLAYDGLELDFEATGPGASGDA